MNVWPIDWQQRTLAAAGIPDTPDTYMVLSAWQQSTPLPPLSNNPLGMPAGSSGAKPYLGTQYAIFPSFGLFTKAFAAFIETFQGSGLAQAMQSDSPYSSTWRIVHALKWPGTRTETDYPASLLDLTTLAYRQSVKATPGPMRKTSGLVTPKNANATSPMSSSDAVNKATQATVTARSVIGNIMRGFNGNGG